MSISKDVLKQCLISKQREVDEAVIVNRPVEFEENGNYVIVGVRHAGKSYLLYQRVRQLKAAGKGWDEILLWTLRMNVWRNSRRRTSTVCWKPTWNCMVRSRWCFWTRCRTFLTGISLCADWLMQNIVFT